ncbi:hypothetical protein CEQ90_06600 [Lewinellaceae bacterium SD302]|nr:hypothetical protein CEQ90_06600 [Lewinellaceae bacterium SD302]
MLRFITPLFLLFACLGNLLAQQFFFDVNQSVKMTAEVDPGGPAITVNWLQDSSALSYELFRREYASGNPWGAAIGSYAPDEVQFIDQDVESGRLYEYKVLKQNENGRPGFGYVLSGVNLAPNHLSGEVLLVITQTTLNEVDDELSEFETVLASDGWPSRRLIVDQEDAASVVKSGIADAYASGAFTAILLLGDIPIPHSGEINPDAHNNHRGGWPADIYYGDLDGNWTDTLVNNVSSANPRNHNVPGDGNWDQSYLPSDVEVAVGRVDFSELPVFDHDEYELLRRYLAKDIAYRTGLTATYQRAMMQNNNPWDGALGQNGIRNFSPLVAPENINYDQWVTVFSQPVEWYYGASSGNYTICFMQGTSETYANDEFQATFTGWFGSYFGDYDYQDAYMRSVLGSGRVLSAVWAGAPHWHFHSMGMGFSLAEATMATQNNDTIYTAGHFPRGIHINLLGDPTLNAYNYPGPSGLVASEQPGFVQLNWQPTESEIDQYYLYLKEPGSQYFSLLDSVDAGITEWRDHCPEPDANFQYLLRASRLETTPSGSFYNLSAGSTATILISGDFSATASFVANQVADSLYLLNTSTFADSISWLLPDGSTSTASELGIQLQDGDNLITLIAHNVCSADTSQQVFPLSSVDDPVVADFEYFPNPAHQYVIVSSDRAFQQLILSDVTGRLISQERFTSAYLRRFSLANLPGGTYVLTVVGNGRRFNRPLVIR